MSVADRQRVWELTRLLADVFDLPLVLVISDVELIERCMDAEWEWFSELRECAS